MVKIIDLKKRLRYRGVHMKKYNVEIDLQNIKPTIVHLNLKFKENILRDFRYVTKENGISMTYALEQFMKGFVLEHRNKGKLKQTKFEFAG
jgi:transcriptional antiterminator